MNIIESNTSARTFTVHTLALRGADEAAQPLVTRRARRPRRLARPRTTSNVPPPPPKGIGDALADAWFR